MAVGEVRLEVPASPEFLRMTRLTTAGVATRVGFSFDEIEDLRIAIDEVCFALMGKRGREGRLVLRYTLNPGEVVVEGTGHFDDDGEAEPTLLPLSSQILQAVTDECFLEGSPDGPHFRLVKRRTGG